MRLRRRAVVAAAVWAWGLASAGVAAADLAVAPDGHTIYLTDLHHGYVSVIDGATGDVTATIPLDWRPGSMAIDPVTQTLHVANGNTVSLIDTATLDVRSNVVFDGRTSGLTLDPTTHTVYETADNASGGAGIDGTTGAVIATIPVIEPAEIAVDPGTNTVYVTTRRICGQQACARDSVGMSIIDGTTRAVTATLRRLGPGVAADPLTHTAYTADMFAGTVSVIDGATHAVIATIPVGPGPLNIAVDPGTQTVYVVNGDDTVSVIDGRTRAVTRTVPVAERTYAVTVDPISHRVYLESREGAVSILPPD